MLTAEVPIHTLARAMKARYGRKMRRVMLDLGLTCPNRDGKKGYGGCVYCDVSGSGTGAAPKANLQSQWQDGLRRLRRKHPEGPVAISYLQSYSNTYPGLQPLQDALEFLSSLRDVAPIVAVGTRPDCFSTEAADLLASYKDRFDSMWIEFGLETADDRVQQIIQRYDTLENFYTACKRAHQRELQIVVHTIAGLPGEQDDGLMKQVEAVRQAGAHGIKFHQLMVLRRTKLESLWKAGELQLLQLSKYVKMVVDALEHLPPHIIVHRLAAEAPPEEYVAPTDWPPKNRILHEIRLELARRNSFQGCRLL